MKRPSRCKGSRLLGRASFQPCFIHWILEIECRNKRSSSLLFGGEDPTLVAPSEPCLRWLSSHSLAVFQHVQGCRHANSDLIYSSRNATFITFQSSTPHLQVV